MECMDYWRLCDDLSIDEAARLLIGTDPIEFEALPLDEPLLPNHETVVKLKAATKALIGALRKELVQGVLITLDGSPAVLIDDIDTRKSRLEVESLRSWLRSRGINTGFFFPKGTNAPDYLDPANPRYAPKLAAAVRAWQSVTDEAGKSPKQSLTKWLRENSALFGMSNDDGMPIEQAIEDVAKVANWKLIGGAPKTPGV